MPPVVLPVVHADLGEPVVFAAAVAGQQEAARPMRLDGLERDSLASSMVTATSWAGSSALT